MDPEAVVVAAGFEQHHLVLARFAEPRGDDAARRARTDDQVVALFDGIGRGGF